MGERIKINGKHVKITREKDYLHFISRNGDVYKAKMQHKGRTKSKQTKTLVKKVGLKREAGYMYYLDSEGYLSKVKVSGRGK